MRGQGHRVVQEKRGRSTLQESNLYCMNFVLGKVRMDATVPGRLQGQVKS